MNLKENISGLVLLAAVLLLGNAVPQYLHKPSHF